MKFRTLNPHPNVFLNSNSGLAFNRSQQRQPNICCILLCSECGREGNPLICKKPATKTEYERDLHSYNRSGSKNVRKSWRGPENRYFKRRHFLSLIHRSTFPASTAERKLTFDSGFLMTSSENVKNFTVMYVDFRPFQKQCIHYTHECCDSNKSCKLSLSLQLLYCLVAESTGVNHTRFELGP
jgi:hypothetical protein